MYLRHNLNLRFWNLFYTCLHSSLVPSSHTISVSYSSKIWKQFALGTFLLIKNIFKTRQVLARVLHNLLPKTGLVFTAILSCPCGEARKKCSKFWKLLFKMNQIVFIGRCMGVKFKACTNCNAISTYRQDFNLSFQSLSHQVKLIAK